MNTHCDLLLERRPRDLISVDLRRLEGYSVASQTVGRDRGQIREKPRTKASEMMRFSDYSTISRMPKSVTSTADQMQDGFTNESIVHGERKRLDLNSKIRMAS